MKLASQLIVSAIVVLAGCGTQSTSSGTGSCAVTVLTVAPASATADHTAIAPANSQQFMASESQKATTPGCVVPLFIADVTSRVTWSVSDTADVNISNGNNSHGLATCVGATSGAVTVTATDPQVTVSSCPTCPTVLLAGSATLTCH